jgi:fermentation-respiration switch protein FrsA (DUF1100 family)
MGNKIVKKTVFNNIPKHVETRFKEIKNKIFYLPTGRNYSIPVLKHVPPVYTNLVLIYSHGNCEDIEMISSLCEHLAVSLKAIVYTYDYCGYGLHCTMSKIKPSESNIYADSLTVLDYVSSKHDIKSIVLYGRSLGTAPAVYSASKYSDIAAVILEAPFLTCAKTVINTKTSRMLLSPLGLFGDNALFANEKFIENIESPIFFIHGKKDTIVPFSHSLELMTLSLKSKSISTLFVDKADHNDLYYICGIRITRNLQKFLSNLNLFTFSPVKNPYLHHSTTYLENLQQNIIV